MLFVGRTRRRVAVELKYYGVIETTARNVGRLRRQKMTNVQPKIDHWFGREVEEVGTAHTGATEAAPSWYIQLEGGVRIYSDDPEIEAPPESDLLGTSLVNMTLDTQHTKLYFRKPQSNKPRAAFPIERAAADITGIVLNATKYRISAPDFEGGEPFNPQMPTITHGTPPHPDDRVTEGEEPTADEVRDAVHGMETPPEPEES
jgi:hypothetical protein